MVKRLINISLLIAFLLLGYCFLNRNPLYAIIQRKIIPPTIVTYKRQVDEQFLSFWASNIFDRGFNRIVGPTILNLLSNYNENLPPKENQFVFTEASQNNIIKLSLPKGFQKGMFYFFSNASSGYTVGISSNLNNWKLSSYPGFIDRLANVLDLERLDLTGSSLYIKFIPSPNDTLTVSFNEFQYVSDQLTDTKNYSGYTLFAPDYDIDYDGKIIPHPVVVIQ